jgi:hypothetical protein
MTVHLIDPDQVFRLATLAGVPRFEEWKRQLEGMDERTESQLRGAVGDAWNACLPTWLELGRVRDLSRAVRAPKYWPSYARELGTAYARKFESEWRFVLGILQSMPVESHEFLCACDLLEMMTCHYGFNDAEAREQIFRLELPLPQALQMELRNAGQFRHVRTIGDYFRQTWFEECGEGDD